jgi:CopG family nickel-responsive transcriptional regulator
MAASPDLSRTGITIPSRLLEHFDQIITMRGYTSRSEGVRDAIRTYITHYTPLAGENGERTGVITIVYEQDHDDLLPAINDTEHEFRSIIEAALHTHVDRERCLEVILVHGEGIQIKGLSDRLRSLKGVESVKLTTVQVEE